MKSRLLATLFAAIATTASVLWAAGLFERSTEPPGTIASDTIAIQVGEALGTSRLLSEVTSFSGPGIAVILSATLLLAAAAALVIELRRNHDRGSTRAQASRT